MVILVIGMLGFMSNIFKMLKYFLMNEMKLFLLLIILFISNMSP